MTASRIAHAQRIARAGPSNPEAKNPSPAVSIVSPRKRASSRRIAALCSASKDGHAPPSSAALAVESTRSVKRTVASTRRRSTARRSHASTRKSAIALNGIQSKRPTSITRLSGIRAAMYRAISVADVSRSSSRSAER